MAGGDREDAPRIDRETEERDGEAEAPVVTAAPVGGMVTSSRPLTKKEMNPYIKGIGKMLSFAGLILAATMFGPAPFLMAAGYMLASKYMENRAHMLVEM